MNLILLNCMGNNLFFVMYIDPRVYEYNRLQIHLRTVESKD
jgi:hypothetical protein